MVIVPLAHKQAYLDRYALPDKAHTPLSNEAHWPVPYWDIDTGFGVMLILLTAVDLGLGALFFGIFQGQQALMDASAYPRATGPSAPSPSAIRRPASAPSPSYGQAAAAVDDVVRWERW